jgi:hypothetical protein
MINLHDGASSLDTRSDAFDTFLDLSTSPKFECDSRALSKASSFLDIDGLLEDTRQQHFLVVDEGLHDPCSPSDLHQLKQYDASATSSAARDKELYCLVVVDNETGIPVRAATHSETDEVARLLADYEPYGLTACPPFPMVPQYHQHHHHQHQQQQHQHHHHHLGGGQPRHRQLIREEFEAHQQHSAQQSGQHSA